MQSQWLLISVLTLLALPTWAETSSDLVGTFSAKEKGELKEVVRIEKHDANYLLSTKKSGAWKVSDKPLEPVTPEQFKKIFKVDEPAGTVGLKNQVFAIFKTDKGWQAGKFKTDTGYFMVFLFGPVELLKTGE